MKKKKTQNKSSCDYAYEGNKQQSLHRVQHFDAFCKIPLTIFQGAIPFMEHKPKKYKKSL